MNRRVLANQRASIPTSTSGAHCTGVTPKSIDEILDRAFGAVGSPLAIPPAVASATSEADLPQGEPADPATSIAVDQVVQTWLTRIFAGDEAHIFVLQTEAMDRGSLARIANTPERLRIPLESDRITTPRATAMEQATAPGRDVRMRADGRIGEFGQTEKTAHPLP